MHTRLIGLVVCALRRLLRASPRLGTRFLPVVDVRFWLVHLVAGIWYIAQAQSLIRLSMGIVLRARGAPVPLRAVLVIVLRARVPPYLYGESVRGRSRHYGNLCVSAWRACFLTAWSTVVAVYAGG